MSAGTPNLAAPGVGHALVMFVAPGSVFRRIGEVCAYGWALGAMLLLITLMGWATVQTGLIDREIDRQARSKLATLEREQIDLLSRTELSERMGKILEEAEFIKLILGGQAIVIAPVGLVVSLMLIAALLFAAVALAGNKPDYPTLMAVCVYSAVVDLLAVATRLAAMLYYRTIEVDTSLGLLAPGAEAGGALDLVLSAIDPFRIWFWVLVALGLTLTGQLSRRAAVIWCALFWMIATGVRMIPMPTGAPGG